MKRDFWVYFCKNFKHMEHIEQKSEKLNSVNLEVIHREEDYKDSPMTGKGLFVSGSNQFLFVQNQPRGRRSRLLKVSDHGRLREGTTGDYLITFRFTAEERFGAFIKEELISELRNLL